MGKDLKATWFNSIWDSVWKFPLSIPTPQVSSLCLNNSHSKEPRKTFRGMCQDSRLRFVLCFNLSLASGKQPWVIAQLFSVRIIKPSQRAKGLCPSISGCSPIFLSLWLSQKLNRISLFCFDFPCAGLRDTWSSSPHHNPIKSVDLRILIWINQLPAILIGAVYLKSPELDSWNNSTNTHWTYTKY